MKLTLTLLAGEMLAMTLLCFYGATFIRFIHQISLSMITKSSAMKFIWMRGVIMGLISSKKEYIGI